MTPLYLQLVPGTTDEAMAGHLVTPDGRFLLPDDPLLAVTGATLTEVVGRRWQTVEPSLATLTPGATVVLQVEPDNEFDPHAVAVLTGPRRHRLGYVPASLAPTVGVGLRAGLHLTATVVRHAVADCPGVLEILIAAPQLLRVRFVEDAVGLGTLRPDGCVTVVHGPRRHVLADQPLAPLALRIAATGDRRRLDTALRWLSRDVSEAIGTVTTVRYPTSRRVR